MRPSKISLSRSEVTENPCKVAFMQYQSASFISLKNHPQFNEAWLQRKLMESPSLLGLGDIEFRASERKQSSGGRLDLLFVDSENRTRYEVEVQLGATDASHIIRTIEYWDLERSKYPNWEHVAVLIAEEVTSRFLNVISIFNKSIPLILIQLKAVQLGELVTLVPTTVLNLNYVADEDEEDIDEATDRNYWISKGSKETVERVDALFEIVNEVVSNSAPKYNKHYIGTTCNGIVDNFVVFRAKKDITLFEVRMPRTEEVDKLIDDAGLDALAYDVRWKRYRLRLNQNDLVESRSVLKQLLSLARGLESETND